MAAAEFTALLEATTTHWKIFTYRICACWKKANLEAPNHADKKKRKRKEPSGRGEPKCAQTAKGRLIKKPFFAGRRHLCSQKKKEGCIHASEVGKEKKKPFYLDDQKKKRGRVEKRAGKHKKGGLGRGNLQGSSFYPSVRDLHTKRRRQNPLPHVSMIYRTEKGREFFSKKKKKKRKKKKKKKNNKKKKKKKHQKKKNQTKKHNSISARKDEMHAGRASSPRFAYGEKRVISTQKGGKKESVLVGRIGPRKETVSPT